VKFTKTVTIVAAVAALGTTIAACGGSGSKPQTAEGAWKAMSNDIYAGRYQAACDHMTAGAQAQVTRAGAFIGAKGCTDVLKKAMASATKSQIEKGIKITKIERKDAEHVVITADNGDVSPMVKVHTGEWLLDASPEDES
jgi:hypothetical protein